MGRQDAEIICGHPPRDRRRLGVNRQRANRIILDDPEFPASVGREGRSRLWNRREVQT
jgi:hypothetical protein